MKDEIKEILDWLERENLTNILDYITNLQEEKERLKELCDKYEEEHNTAFKLWKGKLKETMDETLIQKQYDRIKELEAINEEHRKLNGNLRTANNTLCEVENFMYNQAKEYKSRIDKAVEYIKSNLDNTGWLEIGSQDVEVLLNILKGDDNNE